jgi:alpha-1,2-mannosyltransferase
VDRDPFVIPTDRTTRLRVGVLVGLAVIAFAMRLGGVMLGGGLDGRYGLDDGSFFSSAVAMVDGRLPYRDFVLVHPPGLMYLLSPFALLARATDETTGLGAARLAFMALGAVNVLLVGVVGRRLGWATAVCAAALYAVWLVPMRVERTPFLIAPQTTLLLLVMLQLTGRTLADLTTRRVVIAGVCLGIAGAIQVWAAIPAAVVLGWLLYATRAAPRRTLRLALSFVASGALTALALLGPFLLAAGGQLVEMVVLAQVDRTGRFEVRRLERLRLMEGLPPGPFARTELEVLVVAVLVAILVLVAFVAWRRPAIRLWLAVLAAQASILMITPVFFPHYSGWTAPLAALCVGAGAAEAIAWARAPRWRPIPIVAYGLVVVALAALSAGPAGERLPIDSLRPDLSSARCVAADEPLLLIKTHTLIRSLENGCVVVPNPTGVIHAVNASLDVGPVARRDQPEYQRESLDYYSAGDAALFSQLPRDELTAATMSEIRTALPHAEHVGRVLVLRR